MENRYLFRGKRIDNGEWEIGSLIALPDGKFEIANKCENPPDSDPMWGKCVITHEIDPSTICQCTGRIDRDKTLIFEHDVVAYLDTYSTENGQAEADCVGEVVWDEETLSFQVTNRLSAESWEVLDEECQVLGNTIGNPELLK